MTRGRKLRTDGTVVEANIHYPTDKQPAQRWCQGGGAGSLRRVRAAVGEAAGDLFRDRSRSARRLARSIAETARRRGAEAEAARKGAYGRLLEVAEASARRAGKVRKLLDEEAAGLQGQFQRYEGLIDRVVKQTRARVLEEECAG